VGETPGIRMKSMRVKNLIEVVFFILVVFGGSLVSGEQAGGLFGTVLQDTVGGVSRLNSGRGEDSKFPTQCSCKYNLKNYNGTTGVG